MATSRAVYMFGTELFSEYIYCSYVKLAMRKGSRLLYLHTNTVNDNCLIQKKHWSRFDIQEKRINRMNSANIFQRMKHTHICLMHAEIPFNTISTQRQEQQIMPLFNFTPEPAIQNCTIHFNVHVISSIYTYVIDTLHLWKCINFSLRVTY